MNCRKGVIFASRPPSYLPGQNQVNNQAESNRIVGHFISHFGAQFKAIVVELCVYLQYHADLVIYFGPTIGKIFRFNAVNLKLTLEKLLSILKLLSIMNLNCIFILQKMFLSQIYLFTRCWCISCT